MLDQSKCQIFLSAERRHVETQGFRSYKTVDIEERGRDNKALGSLYRFTDDTLAEGKKLSYLVEEDCYVMLLPVVGAVGCKVGVEQEMFIRAGEAFVFSALKGSSLEFTNPYESGLVNFIQLWFRKTDSVSHAGHHVSFDIEKNRNDLIEIFPGNEFPGNLKISIGKFTGRGELRYGLNQAHPGVFVFVIEGAFEVQYRLMEGRDALSLSGCKEVDIEALSNDAILLLVEMNLPGS